MKKLLRLGCPKGELMSLVTSHPDVQGEDMQWYAQQMMPLSPLTWHGPAPCRPVLGTDLHLADL